MQVKSIFQVDAFTAEPFKGNPAGVMVVLDDITTDRMQQLATEMNLSETAFIIPKHDNLFQIRYFTPAKEVDLCGHATLASAHILYETGRVASDEQIQFKAKGADLTVSKSDDWLVMDFPRYPLTPSPPHPSFKALVGFEPVELYDSSYHWVIAVANSEDEVQNASPVFSALTEAGLGHLMITAPASTPGYDFVLRCFAPWAGIDEDPVTGSAHCALTPLWTEKLGKTQLTSLQVSKRTGTLKTELSGDCVIIKGQAVTVFKIELRIKN
jgi:phenazine biosynthesis protein PhzF family